MENQNSLLHEELVIDAEAHQHLFETVKWAKFLGIVGFVLSGIIVLIAFFAGSMIGNMSSMQPGFPAESAGGLGVMISIMYLVGAAINFALSLFMYRFATKTKQALLSTDQVTFNQGLHNLKLLYRVAGIIVIIYLAIVAIALLVGVAASAFA